MTYLFRIYDNLMGYVRDFTSVKQALNGNNVCSEASSLNKLDAKTG